MPGIQTYSWRRGDQSQWPPTQTWRELGRTMTTSWRSGGGGALTRVPPLIRGLAEAAGVKARVAGRIVARARMKARARFLFIGISLPPWNPRGGDLVRSSIQFPFQGGFSPLPGRSGAPPMLPYREGYDL